jgi:hypothetical protein
MTKRLDPEIARRVLAQSMGYEDEYQVPLHLLQEAVQPTRIRDRDPGDENDANERRRAQLRPVKDDKGA